MNTLNIILMFITFFGWLAVAVFDIRWKPSIWKFRHLKKLDEKELSEIEMPWIKTPEDLLGYIEAISKRPHDYGTAVYAMSLSALAAFNYSASIVGATGFQASCADLDFLKRTRHIEHGFRIIRYGDLLYPQYCNNEHFPDLNALLIENKEMLQKEAQKRLDCLEDYTSENVVKHWQWLASGQKTQAVQE